MNKPDYEKKFCCSRKEQERRNAILFSLPYNERHPPNPAPDWILNMIKDPKMRARYA